MTIINISKKDYKAYLVSRKIVLMLAVAVILSANFFVGISEKNIVSASGGEDIINVNNLLREHNLERVNNNLKPLKLNNNLALSATEKANVMIETECWSHYCPENVPPWDYIQKQGYTYRLAGENLAEGFFDVDSVMKAWLDSKTHKENILKPEYEEIGFGIVRGNFKGLENNLVIVVHFGTQNQQAFASTSNLDIILTEPKEGAYFTVNEVGVSGQTNLSNSVEIYNNGILKEVLDVTASNFKGNLDKLNEGKNTLYASTVSQDGLRVKSNEVNIYVDLANNFEIDDEIYSASSIVEIPRESKNAMNIVFLLILSFLFFIDFWFISKVDVLKKHHSLSHLSGLVFFIAIILVASGSISGSVLEGITI